MPELPEVETVRCGLAPVLVGARLKRVELRRPNLRFPFAPDFVERLEGQRVEALERRAKYLLMRLESGETVLLHLGMSGRFLIETADDSGKNPQKPGYFYQNTDFSANTSMLSSIPNRATASAMWIRGGLVLWI